MDLIHGNNEMNSMIAYYSQLSLIYITKRMFEKFKRFLTIEIDIPFDVKINFFLGPCLIKSTHFDTYVMKRL